jgi:hypothetical protein
MPWVRTQSPEVCRELVAELAAARCLVREVDRTTLLVMLPGAAPAHALAEIRFFVAAWAARRARCGASVTAERP